MGGYLTLGLWEDTIVTNKINNILLQYIIPYSNALKPLPEPGIDQMASYLENLVTI